MNKAVFFTKFLREFLVESVEMVSFFRLLMVVIFNGGSIRKIPKLKIEKSCLRDNW